MAKFILNADDLGLRPSINRGVKKLLQRGVVSSATIVTNRDPAAFDHAAGMACDFADRAGFGLHLDLDEFFHFDASGRFGLHQWDAPDDFHDVCVSNRNAIVAAALKQLEALRGRGVHVTHVDGHHNVHLFPDMLDILCPVLADQGVAAMRFCPRFYDSEENLAAARGLMQEHNMAVPDECCDLSETMSGDWFHQQQDDTVLEVVVHADAPDAHEHWRVLQYEFLMSNRSLLRELGLNSFKVFQG